jgi:surface protein
MCTPVPIDLKKVHINAYEGNIHCIDLYAETIQGPDDVLDINGTVNFSGVVTGITSTGISLFINSAIVTLSGTTVDISGSSASISTYNAISIMPAGSNNRIYADQTPPNALPAFSTLLTTVTFTGYNIASGDIIYNEIFTSSTTASSLSFQQNKTYQYFGFVQTGTELIIPWTGLAWAYSFVVYGKYVVIANTTDAVNYINNAAFSIDLTTGFFQGLTSSNTVLNNILVYPEPNPNAFVISFYINTFAFTGIGLSNLGNFDITVAWGDIFNTVETVVSIGGLASPSNYVKPGIYVASFIANIPLASFSISSNGNLVDILQWGNTGMTGIILDYSQFLTTISAGPIPTSLTSLAYMFQGCTAANPDVSNWDVSNITDMSFMFEGAAVANPDVSNWDVSNVTNMNSMFYNTALADPDVSNWNVSNVQVMDNMFNNTASANPDVSNWNTSSLVSMGYMFQQAKVANPNVTNWTTSNLQSAIQAFEKTAAANPDISNWDLSSINNFYALFDGATAFTVANYDKALIAVDNAGLAADFWGSNYPVVPGYSQGPSPAATAHANLLLAGWSLIDGGPV